MSVTYLSLGGNTGNRLKNLKSAVDILSHEAGNIIRTSSVYETEPYGFRDKRQFLNMCIRFETGLSPHRLLEVISGIESSLGRKRHSDKYVSRNIDIDILFYDDIILNDPALTIPHPELQKRNFVLVPMAEIEPGLIHPVLRKSIKKLLEVSDDKHQVELFQGPFSL